MDGYDQWYLNAFWQLNTMRPVGFGYGPIPHDSVVAYAEREGLDEVATKTFCLIIREMDSAFLTWHAENRKADPPQGGTSRRR